MHRIYHNERFDYVKINSINLLSIIIGEVDGYIEEKNGNKYLIFTDKNKEVLEKPTKRLIKTINGGEEGEYEKDFMKIKFNSNDNFSLNKALKLTTLIIC